MTKTNIVITVVIAKLSVDMELETLIIGVENKMVKNIRITGAIYTKARAIMTDENNNSHRKLTFTPHPEQGYSLTGRKISDPEPPCHLCRAGHKPTSQPRAQSEHMRNYLSQINYAEIEQRVVARMVRDFNDSNLKSRIVTFQDELQFWIADGEKTQVVTLLEKLGFHPAEHFINKYYK